MTDFEIQADIDRKVNAHKALAEKKDDLWDLCQKYIDRNGVVDEHIADAVANHPEELFNDNRAGQFLREVAQLVGYAHPETLLAKLEQLEMDEAAAFR